MSWADDARCQRYDPEMFFPDKDDEEGIAAAKAVCGNCPVRQRCLAAAHREENGQAQNYRFGIRGSKTPTERWEEVGRNRACINCGGPLEEDAPSRRMTCSDECRAARRRRRAAA